MAGGAPRQDDAEITMALLVVIAFLFLWAFWSYAKQPIVEGIRWIKWVEVAAFQLIDPSLAKERKLLETLTNDQNEVRRLGGEMEKQKRRYTVEGWVNEKLLAPDVLWHVSNRVGSYLRWPVLVFLFGSGIFFMYFSHRTKFKNYYDLEGLIKVQKESWPVVSPILDFNPILDNARKPGEPVPTVLPTFSEALMPEEWVAFHRIPIVNKVPDKDALRRAFQLQLGPRWTGLSCLTTAQRCLFAAFALKGAQKRKDSDRLLGELAKCWNYKTDFNPTPEVMAEVEKILKDPKIGGEALKVADNYAWRTTAMLGVLKFARERGGVLAPASFLWLRGHDRDLWYPLNNLGRRSFHAEGAGAMGHYMAEKIAGMPLPIPRFETAILTITQYWGINNPKVPPVEESTKKKG